MEEGEFPSLRRSLQAAGGTQVGTSGMTWADLIERLTGTVMLERGDYYNTMLEGLWDMEWCLRSLVPWRLCYYPTDSPKLPAAAGGGTPPRPSAERKAVYARLGAAATATSRDKADDEIKIGRQPNSGYGRP